MIGHTLLDELDTAIGWLQSGKQVAMTTVLETWGSAPCPVGRLMFIADTGEFVGSVSGGCIESELLFTAPQVLHSQRGQRLEFGVAHETAWAQGLACGGSIQVFLQPIALDALVELRSALQQRQPVCLEIPECDFTHTYQPAPKVFVIGAVHISQALAKMAYVAGFPIEIVDPRQAFATAERFPNTVLHAQWPVDFFQKNALDAYSAVIAVTHDSKIDDQALLAAVQSDCFYIGALGSRASHAKRCQRLLAAGADTDQVARIHGPVGVAIQAKSPAEIAVSILAELIEQFHESEKAHSEPVYAVA